MAKSKVSNSEILTYLQERKKSLKKELEQVEKVLNSIDVEEKPSNKKGKKKNKKKLEKAVKAIRKKVSEAIEGVIAPASPDTETRKQPVKRTRKPRLVDKPASASAVTTVPAVVTEEKKPVRRKTAAVKKVEEPETANEPGFEPSSTMDEKIRYALGQKRSSTKEELIEYLNGLEPDYGLSKLRKVVAFRLNHLLKSGKIKGKESKAGIRYTN